MEAGMPKVIEMTEEQLNAEVTKATEEIQKSLEAKQTELDNANKDTETKSETIKALESELEKLKSDKLEAEKEALEKIKQSIIDEQKRGAFGRQTVIGSGKEAPTFGMGTIAIAKILAKKESNGRSHIDILNDHLKNNPDDINVKAALVYENDVIKSNQHHNDYTRFEEKIKAVNLGSVLEGGGVGFTETVSALLPDLAFNQIQGITRTRLTNGVYTYNEESSEPTMYWGQESATLTESSVQNKAHRLQAKKGYALVKISNDALRLGDTNLAADIQRRILRSVEAGFDTGYISGSGNVNQPLGIYNAAAYSQAATASPTSTKIKKDLIAMKVSLENANVRFNNPHLLMTRAMRTALTSQYTSNADLMRYAMEIEMSNTLMGVPIVVSNYASSDKVAMVEGSELLIAEGNGFFIDADASIGFNTDETSLRVVAYTDINYYHKNSEGKALGVGIITGTNTTGSDWITS